MAFSAHTYPLIHSHRTDFFRFIARLLYAYVYRTLSCWPIQYSRIFRCESENTSILYTIHIVTALEELSTELGEEAQRKVGGTLMMLQQSLKYLTVREKQAHSRVSRFVVDTKPRLRPGRRRTGDNLNRV